MIKEVFKAMQKINVSPFKFIVLNKVMYFISKGRWRGDSDWVNKIQNGKNMEGVIDTCTN